MWKDQRERRSFYTSEMVHSEPISGFQFRLTLMIHKLLFMCLFFTTDRLMTFSNNPGGSNTTSTRTAELKRITLLSLTGPLKPEYDYELYNITHINVSKAIR